MRGSPGLGSGRPGQLAGALTLARSALQTSCSLSGVMVIGTSKGEPRDSPASSRNWIRSRCTSSSGDMLCGRAGSGAGKPPRGVTPPGQRDPRGREGTAAGEPGVDPAGRSTYRAGDPTRGTARRRNPGGAQQAAARPGTYALPQPRSRGPRPAPAPLTAAMCPRGPRGPEAAPARRGGRRGRGCPLAAGGGHSAPQAARPRVQGRTRRFAPRSSWGARPRGSRPLRGTGTGASYCSSKIKSSKASKKYPKYPTPLGNEPKGGAWRVRRAG